MNKPLTQRNVQRIIGRKLYEKFGFDYESKDDLERVKFVATELNKIQDEQDTLRGLVTEIQRIYSNRFYYQISGVSLESIGDNYEPKYFKPNEDISFRVYSPDLSQRPQDSEKNVRRIEDSTIWSPEHQISVLLMTGTQTTNGMIRILGNTINWDEEKSSTIGIYDTNTKTHILSSFWSNPTCELFEVTDKIRNLIKEYQKGLIGFNQPELLEPILEKILEQSNGTHLNRKWFEDNGFVDFINNIRYTDVTIHITKCNPSQTKLLYNTLATVQREQSDLNLLSGDLNTYFGNELYDGLGKEIRNRLFNNFNGLSEPLFVMNTSFYNTVFKENQGTGYDSKDRYFLEMLPLYFFDLEKGKFDYDRVPSFDNKFGELLWGVGKKKKVGHIKSCFEYIHSIKDLDERNQVITEWRNLILDLHQLWTYLGEEVDNYEAISTSSGTLAKKIKPKLVNDYNLVKKDSPLTKKNIAKLYDMNSDGSFPMTSILLNTYSFIKRTTNLNVIHGKTIFSLIPKYYTENYCEFLSNPQMTKHLLEDKLQNTWLDKNPNKSLSSTLNVLFEIAGDDNSIGSDGVLHIHNQFYKKVLETKVSNDSIFKAMASEQKTKATLLTNCDKVGINHIDNPIMMTTHGLVRNYGNVSDKEYLNIGHFTMKKDGGLVYVLKSDDDNQIDELRFLAENVEANQYKEKKVQKDYHLWWDKQFRYNNYLVSEAMKLAKGEFFDEKQIEGDGSEFYYTHNIEDFDGEEQRYLQFKNAQYLQTNLKKIVGFMDGIEWNRFKDYQNIDYIVKEEKEELELV